MSAPAALHVVGAGMAGLAAAVAAAAQRLPVHLYESAGQAGGRCRSFFDAYLERTIDNGNHLVLSGNHSLARYLQVVGATDELTGPARAIFPFMDIRTNERWCVRPSRGRVPWWVLSRSRRVPGTAARDYLNLMRFAVAPRGTTVHACAGSAGALYERFLEPLAVGALNASPHEGAAKLLWPVVRETFAKGERYCRPRLARRGLSEALVQPALSWLARHGATVHYSHRLRALETLQDRVHTLDFGHTSIAVGRRDHVILAVPHWIAAGLLPGLSVPRGHGAIVNAHYVVQAPPPVHLRYPFVGVIGGTAQWVFIRGDVVSVTVSAADALVRISNEELARNLWANVAAVLDVAPVPVPRCRIIKEKRATFLQSPENLRLRPPCGTALRNTYLAGDWTDTGLPATIEGAVRSGFTAVRGVLRAHNRRAPR